MMRFRLTDPKQAHVIFEYLRGVNLEGWGTHFWMWTLLWSRPVILWWSQRRALVSLPSQLQCNVIVGQLSSRWENQLVFPENGNDFLILAFSPFPFHSVESHWVRQTHLQRTPKSPLCLLAFLENWENLAIQPKVLMTTGQTGSTVLSGSLLSPLNLLTSS